MSVANTGGAKEEGTNIVVFLFSVATQPLKKYE